MPSDPTSWLSLLGALLGAASVGTVTGALVTTYGGRGRERREARSKAMESLGRIETARGRKPIGNGAYYDRSDFAELNSRCLVAGVPRSVITVYEDVCHAHARLQTPDPGHREPLVFTAFLSGFYLSDQAARLIQNAMWHPHRSRLLRRWRLRRLRSQASDLFGDAWKSGIFESTYQEWRRLSGTGRRFRLIRRAVPKPEAVSDFTR